MGTYEQAYIDAQKKGWTKSGETKAQYITRAKQWNKDKYGTSEPSAKASASGISKSQLAEKRSKEVEAGRKLTTTSKQLAQGYSSTGSGTSTSTTSGGASTITPSASPTSSTSSTSKFTGVNKPHAGIEKQMTAVNAPGKLMDKYGPGAGIATRLKKESAQQERKNLEDDIPEVTTASGKRQKRRSERKKTREYAKKEGISKYEAKHYRNV